MLGSCSCMLGYWRHTPLLWQGLGIAAVGLPPGGQTCVTCSQSLPVTPAGQVQWYELSAMPRPVQVAPLRHGLLLHSSKSTQARDFDTYASLHSPAPAGGEHVCLKLPAAGQLPLVSGAEASPSTEQVAVQVQPNGQLWPVSLAFRQRSLQSWWLHIAVVFPGSWKDRQFCGGGFGVGGGLRDWISRVTMNAAPPPAHAQAAKKETALMHALRCAALVPSRRSSSVGRLTVALYPSFPGCAPQDES